MKMPLNYAILKHFIDVEEASTEEVMEALKDDYGNYKAFNKKDVLLTLMTAEANGLLEEKRFDLDENNELRIFYYANEEGAATINKYIKD